MCRKTLISRIEKEFVKVKTNLTLIATLQKATYVCTTQAPAVQGPVRGLVHGPAHHVVGWGQATGPRPHRRLCIFKRPIWMVSNVSSILSHGV